jgi:DNA-binding MarR family transcriptional regulator
MSMAYQEAPDADISPAVLAIMRLSRALECAETGLTPPQYRILKLAGAGGERSTRLARRLAVTKPTLTAIADGLVAAGYAIREAEPGDRRVVRLSLTAAGRAALERADAVYAAQLGPLLAQTGEPATVLRSLDLLDAALTRERQARHETGTGETGTGRKNHEHAH